MVSRLVGGPFGYLFLGLSIIWHGIVSYRGHKNCEVHRCWRLGRHETAAGHAVCRKHHPDEALTAETILAEHGAAVAEQAVVIAAASAAVEPKVTAPAGPLPRRRVAKT